MKKELSFYEFVGILVPGCTFLYGLNLVLRMAGKEPFVDFDKIGEAIVFLVVCYGIGHFVQALGNIYEWIIWKVYGGMPTQWLKKKNSFGKHLFSQPFNQRVLEKVEQKFGTDSKEMGRLAFNNIFLAGKSARIDIFNGNYSLFRGLSVCFLLLALACTYYFNWWQSLLSFVPLFFLTRRMIRFAKYYATELYRTTYNM
jgi:hypothetical protein